MCRWKVDSQALMEQQTAQETPLLCWYHPDFVKIGRSLFPRRQQHSHKDGDDEEGQDSSNHGSSHCYG